MRFSSLRGLLCAASLSALGVAGCSVYDASLLTGGSGGGGGGDTTSTSNTGGSTACKTPSECPGEDGPCGKRTCDDGVCGVDREDEGKAVTDTVNGDCQRSVCDGMGEVRGEADPTDTPDDMKQCTTEVCAGGVVQTGNAAPKTPCTEAGGAVCDGAGHCVECYDATNCPGGVCNAQNECAPGTCTDMAKNNGESDTDCGGPCDECANGRTCNAATDCISSACNVTCQPSCTDMLKSQDETDIDCGGLACGDCTFGQSCLAATDCDTGRCGANMRCTCNTTHLVISEVKTRAGSAGDEFVELYNPTSAAITLTTAFIIESRSETAMTYDTRFTGSGQVIPPNHHFLIGGTAFAGTKDATLVSGIADEVSVVLRNGASVVDALCFNCGTNSFTAGHVCEGTIVTGTGCTGTTDKSFERKPGNTGGNCIDGNDNSADFQQISPSLPQSLASGAVP